MLALTACEWTTAPRPKVMFDVTRVPYPTSGTWDVSVSSSGVAYASAVDNSAITRIDLATNGWAGAVQSGLWPYEISFSPAGDIAYASNLEDSTITVINTITNLPTTAHAVAARPIRVKVSPDGTRLYVTSVSGYVFSLNAATGVETHPPIFVSGVLNGLVVTPDGTRLWVSNTGGLLAEINTDTWAIARSIIMGGRPQDIITTADGSSLLVANESGWVGVYALASLARTDSIESSAPFALALNPAGTQLFVSSPTEERVRVLRTADWSLAGVLLEGLRPRNVAFHSDGTAIIANETGGLYVVRQAP